MSQRRDREPGSKDQVTNKAALAETIPHHKQALVLGETLHPDEGIDPALSHTLPPPDADLGDAALHPTLSAHDPRLLIAAPPPASPAAKVLGETLGPEPAPAPANAATKGATLGDAASPRDARTTPGEPIPDESVVSVSQREFPVSNWDHYEFIRLLGQGGMGAVYKGRDKRLNRIVALKFIRGSDPNLVMRFIQEARAQARIDHPNICKVYEVGQVQGQTYIAMQYIDGGPLDRVGPAMSLTQKVLVIKTVAEAMHEAHRLGIIHRDPRIRGSVGTVGARLPQPGWVGRRCGSSRRDWRRGRYLPARSSLLRPSSAGLLPSQLASMASPKSLPSMVTDGPPCMATVVPLPGA